MRCTSVLAFDETYTPDGWDFPNITRPFSILYYVLGGSAYYEIDGQEHPFQKDHLYVMPANRVFSLREDLKDKFYSVYIHAFTSPEAESVTVLPVEEGSFLEHTLSLIRRYIQKEDDLCVEKLIEMLISYLSSLSPDLTAPLHAKIKEYVETHTAEVFHMGDFDRHFNYSRSYLTKVFKSEYNLTPKQYAGQLLLKEITLLLGEGQSVAEIAAALRFSSPENMCRFFRVHYGCSPTEYKKRYSGSLI